MMKTRIRTFLMIMVAVMVATSSFSQKIYKFDTVQGDPLKARIYTLANGLKVYMSVYKDAPRIQTAIAVRTGSKNDPTDNTGLSHYLEHMMFKGSDEYGTMDYAKEKPLLDMISAKFEEYKKTTNPATRTLIYHQIDSLSGVASTYAIANEYDKLLAVIGAKGTNAFTSFEETVYINDIPSNKVQPWLAIEFERFKDPVFRLFHTELETVYEEKNISLDNDDDKIFEELFAGLFRKNTYGTQTTIGQVEHLKNPSLNTLQKYYESRYVPNNMAILIAGDFNPSEVIKMIDATFGKLQSKPVKQYVPAKEDSIVSPIVKEVLGPDAESVTIGYRLGGVDTQDADKLELFNMILSNSTAGLIDLNLNQGQKVLEAGSFSYILKDYSAEVLYGKAKENQTLEDVRDLILDQIERVKSGAFPDWLIPAIITDMKYSEIKSSESNQGRVFSMLDDFVQEIPRSKEVNKINRLSKITKEDIIAFANANFKNNYVIVFKRTGEAPETNKVVKPQITPVTMNRDEESAFLKKINAMPTASIEPVFLDYDKDVKKLTMKGNVPVLYALNKENQTFSLYYYFDMGISNQKAIGIALNYLKYLGTAKLSASQVQEEFYKLGCSFNVSSSDNEVWVSLTGLSENMEKGMLIFEELLSDAQPDEIPFQNLVLDIRKRRTDDKLNKNTILWSAMYNFGVYGNKSPFTNIYPEDSLKRLSPDFLVSIIKDLNSYQHRVMYYGPQNAASVIEILNKQHKVPSALKPVPEPVKFAQLPTDNNNVYSVGYDMKQVEIIMMSNSDLYNKDRIPVIRLFNEYFGGGMNSVVFQEIRESKGLAYSAYAGYRAPVEPEDHYYLFSYIGTQNDKLPEAMKAMMGLFNATPESEKALNASKDAIINKIRTERITKSQVLFNYINAQKFGLTYDIRKDVFEKVPAMTFADLKTFQETSIKNKKFSILVLGKQDEIDKKTLQTYGTIKELSLEDVFGY